MDNINFNHIHKYGTLVMKNELFNHVHNPEVLLQYDSNFIKFNRVPTKEEFLNTEAYLMAYHKKYGQEHVKFYFPEGEKLPTYLTDYFHENNFSLGFLELYAINPASFPKVESNINIQVHEVTIDTLDMYLNLQFKEDSSHGETYAKQKQAQCISTFSNNDILQMIAFYQNAPAGAVDVIVKEQTVEIDNLLVATEFQRKGIGSSIQKYIMDRFPEKTVILVADGEDTPRHMYRKQNYQYLGFQYEAMKVFSCS
ncbi:N-acetyltransferase [Bacillus sp. HMF5848]|nr:N-acetyltransferase [Bacillus sp. HMF5848]